MAEFTRFTNLEVTGVMKQTGLTKTDYSITSADATAAAGTAPTKAEYDAVVTLVNELKADVNKLVNMLCTGSNT